jgi:hypothetical protein
VPGPRDISLQYVDVRDLAAFTMRQVVEERAGAFTVAGPWPAARFVDVVEQIARHVGPPGTSIVEIGPEAVEGRNLAGKFPLWSGPTNELAMEMDPSAAIAAGLTLRRLEDSVGDVVTWWQDRPWPGQWLTGEEEATLLAGGG